ncbi:MAG: amino acid adenylation domain-containing protein [Elusimicrobia bacterium]|nr:amino acid adenylation domain-containing protein [Elusimicrobiota bacterium]
MSEHIIGAFRDAVRRRPAAEAVSGAGRRWTYAELAGRAEAVARGLRRNGAGPESVVGLCLERTPDYVASVLGAWSARAAFLPLDPAAPRERLAFQVRDAGVRLALADAAGRRALAGLGPRCLAPDGFGQAPGRAAGSAGRPGDLAYVIYTSGSSGRPKGALVTHRGLMPMLRTQVRAFGLGPGKKALLYLSTSFDASLSDLGTALASGAALHAEPASALDTLERVLGVVEAEGITHWDLPPCLLRLLPERLPRSLETLVIGGEAAEPKDVRRWAAKVRLVSVYGPTEATICSSLTVCGTDWRRPLLGRPVAQTRLRVLGADLQPAAEGELCISGSGLARGYLNLPEMTAERFVRVRGERVYRTGDRVRRLPGGALEFLGRLDRQVKLRGHRVEPEEVERALARHPACARAAVAARPEGGRMLLLAFVEPLPGRRLSSSTLRRHLARLLPAWMLPHRIRILAKLPVTPSGKPDPSALGAVPSRTDGARDTLSRIWRRALGIERAGPRDDFHRLGGDSLAALEITASAEAAGIALAPDWPRASPTIAGSLAGAGRPAPGALPAEALRRRVRFDAAWTRRLARAAARKGAPLRQPYEILLTGATGFLGSRLLLELLARSGARITCLVRAASAREAERRVLDGLERQGLSLPAYERGRVCALRGDIERPRFGLAPGEWRRLAGTLDAIHHCAARVQLLASFRELEGPNVEGTRQVLRLLCEGRPKRLHYASTLSVFVSADSGSGVFREDDSPARARWVHGGYAQSKWAAEMLLREAEASAGPIAFYRLGLLTGDRRTGRLPDRDLLRLFIRGLARLGRAPEAKGLHVDITPVDYAAAALAHLSLGAAVDAERRTFHIANPRPLRVEELLAAVARRSPIRRVERDEWRRLVERSSAAGPAFLALSRALGPAALARHRPLDLFQATGARFDRTATEAGLAGTGIACPAPEGRLLDSYVRAALAAP